MFQQLSSIVRNNLFRPLITQKVDQNPSLFLLYILQIANEVIGEMNLKPEEVFLAQGTLRPDLIESASLVASGKAEVIKTHHNDTELIRKLREEVNENKDTAVSFWFSQIGS